MLSKIRDVKKHGNCPLNRNRESESRCLIMVVRSRLYEYNNDFLTKGQLPDLVKLGEKGDPAKSEPTGDEEQGATERESAFKQIMLVSFLCCPSSSLSCEEVLCYGHR